jgi:hypothetical protein
MEALTNSMGKPMSDVRIARASINAAKLQAAGAVAAALITAQKLTQPETAAKLFWECYEAMFEQADDDADE